MATLKTLTDINDNVIYPVTRGVAVYLADGTTTVEAGLALKANISSLATVATSGSFADLLNKPTTLAGYGITDAYTKAEVDAKTTSAMHYKGTVATVADLPASATIGDVYNVTATGDNYAWDGTAWDKLSGVVDLTAYRTSADQDTIDNGIKNRLTTAETKLSGIETGAEANVQSDWNITDTTSDAYIKNKPTIPSAAILYGTTGQNTDGAMTQKATTDALASCIYASSEVIIEPIA